MIELTFREFYDLQYDDNQYCVYVMKNGAIWQINNW